ncbi:class I SAM-dependent methyltransferase [Diplocloster agilis]|uniref:Methyltransferase domain-containing protein n=1 Tax=Diplocloster agilis TaxID=2850323 RepID=A0A949JWQ0_9FIRM|nr:MULTISPECIES: class I SAM-dependent methyltransferase [Lachnospiraceae]MBU9736568.1 methyltransferase domain-containing protein [Diplocloster agilis]MCU6735172.1 methyltransferase domain-containing protein [Suonthocola fibrivorans]SCJ66322.1 methionine biosynthesis protein MetW [uncultured Clostridium sp.]
MKYDFDLDLVHTTSLSLIYENIAPNSTVLEFGPANGRLTKYLKEELKCDVYLVEIEEEAGAEALKFGKELIVGDIEEFKWVQKYRNIKFDYMIFADVLEHLRNPEKVLLLSKGLLKQEGSMFISVPNLAHNSVVIDLINNKFQYSDIGLLDNTHIHFFTVHHLNEMLARAGLFPANKYATYCEVGKNEIINNYDSVIGIDESFWKNREFGDIYQFIYEVKKDQEFIKKSCNFLKRTINHYHLQCLWDDGSGFREEYSERYFYSNIIDQHNISFIIPENTTNIRIDPIKYPCILKVIDCSLIDDYNSTSSLELVGHNADLNIDQNYVFLNGFPSLVYKHTKNSKKEKLNIKLEIKTIDKSVITNCMILTKEFLESYQTKYNFVKENLDKQWDISQQLSKAKEALDNKNKELDTKVNDLNNVIRLKDSKLFELQENFNKEISNRDNQIKNLNLKLQEKTSELKSELEEKEKELETLRQNIFEKIRKRLN